MEWRKLTFEEKEFIAEVIEARDNIRNLDWQSLCRLERWLPDKVRAEKDLRRMELCKAVRECN